MPAMTFLRPRLMQWNNNNITEHNRQPLGISVERLQRSNRMANGTLRNYFIADKHTFTVDWTDVPRTTIHTVDGFWGGEAMKDFYTSTTGSFPLKIYYGDGTVKTFTVVFSNFNATISKRGVYDFWNVSCEMTEV